MTPGEVSDGLGLDTLKDRQWAIYKACAIKGEGLEEGLDWWVPSFFVYVLTCANPLFWGHL
jgi:ADP-ribosylation factor-like protein 1